ncbi:MAG: tetratricopeptide repeat protein [Planctomycetota bacterium]|jgi:type VI secretion system protein ImpE
MLRFAAEDASSVHSLTGHDVSARSVTEAIVVKAEELLRSGQLHEALAALESEVRADPANAKLRVFLFQLLCVLGDWERALTQLNTAAELDAVNAGRHSTVRRSEARYLPANARRLFSGNQMTGSDRW